MDPLLPVEPTRKKVPDTDYDVTQRYRSERHRTHVCLGLSPIAAVHYVLQCLYVIIMGLCQSYNNLFLFKERYEERHREPRLTLRPPSLAAPYAPVQNWHHQPEKLIFESCAYEASVRPRLSPPYMLRLSLNIDTNTEFLSLSYSLVVPRFHAY